MRIVTLKKKLQGGSDECQGSRESKVEVGGELGVATGVTVLFVSANSSE